MPQLEPISVRLHAAYTNRMYLTPKVRSFIDYLAAAHGLTGSGNADRRPSAALGLTCPVSPGDARMKALLCKQHGLPDTLVVEETPDPVAGPGEVVVGMKAAGVNFPDVLIIQNKYQFKPPLPFSPGAELAGVVSAVGQGVDRFKVGDRVIGSCGHGAFAEKVKVPATRLIPLPAGVDFETGAAFTLTYGTSWHAVKDRAALQPGETLLVLGAAGGVGLAAIEIGKALGARVIAAASSEEKLAGVPRPWRGRHHQLFGPRTCASGSRRSPTARGRT